MKQTFCLLILIVSNLACKKSNTIESDLTGPSSEPTTQGIAPYSGTWLGRIDIEDRNPTLCIFTGDPVSVIQDWVVSVDSTLSIYETRIYSSNPYKKWFYTWKGRLINQDSLSVKLDTLVSCSGKDTTLKATMNGRINKLSVNEYELKTKVDYSMCPPDCLFYFNYSMKKE